MKVLLLTSLLLFLCSSQLLGIDLGTMYTKVATVQPGAGLSFTILENTKSERKIETAISFYNGQRFYEQQAVSKRSKTTKNSFLYTKMFIDMMNSPDNFTEISKQYFLHHNIHHQSDPTLINFIISQGFKSQLTISLQQIFGMIFKHIRDLAQKLYSKIKIQDCVITIPFTWRLKQRTLIINALKIAGLNPLHIVNENSAAAVQYGINRELNQTHKVLFYNLGANSLELSVAEYRKEKGTNGKKQIVEVFVLGGYGLNNVGGLKFDQIVAKRLEKVYQEKYKKELSEKGRVRLLGESKKIKEILSANREIHVGLQQLDGVDFHTVFSRYDFQTDARQLFTQLTSPILPFLSSLSLSPSDIKYVQLIGGSSRIPKIQQLISTSLFKQSQVGTHINGDESMAFGSAFIAANSSKKYKVKGLQLYDGFYNFDIGMRIRNLNERIEEGDEGYVNKDVKVFKKGQRFGLVKDILLKTKENVIVEFVAEYDDGTEERIKRVKILNVTEYEKEYPGENPKLSLSIKTNTIDIVDLVEAKLNIVRDEESAYFEQVKKEGSTKKESKSKDEEESEQEKDSNDEKSGDESKQQKEKQKEKKKTKESNDQYQTVRKTRLVSKTHSLKLKLQQQWLSSPFFTESELQVKRNILYKFQKSEQEERKLAEVKNKLQGLIYEAQELLETKWFIEYSLTEEREKIKEQISVNQQKLYQTLDFSQFTTIYKQFNRIIQKIKTRRNQHQQRDRVKSTVYQNIQTYQDKYQKFVQENDWLTESQREKFNDMVKYVDGQLETAYGKLRGIEKTDDPVVLNKQLLRLVDKVKEEYMSLISIQKPKKIKKEEDKEKEKEKEAKEQSDKKEKQEDDEEKIKEKKQKKQKSKAKKKAKDDYMDQL